VYNGGVSSTMSISASIVQGSSLGPASYAVIELRRHQWQRAVAVCPARLTASRSERRPADCLQNCSGVEADVRLARLERLRNGALGALRLCAI